MNKGFLSVAVVLAIAITAAVTAGGGYGVYKYQQVVKEKERIEEALMQERQNQTEEVVGTAALESSEVENQIPEDDRFEENKFSSDIQLKPTIVSSPEVKKPASVQTEEATADIVNPLQIYSVNAATFGTFTIVTWETNKKSDSRLLIGEDFYVSDNADSLEHEVTLSGLARSSIYNYQIIATAGSEEKDYFGKFSTPLEYEARLAYSKSEGCIVVIMEDSQGTPVPGVEIKITGAYYGGSTRLMSKTLQDVTNIHGEVEYCSKIEEITIVDASTGEKYYSGVSPLY